MESMQAITKTPPNRQRRLRSYLVLFGIEGQELAKALGVTPTTMSRLLLAETAPSERVEQLAALGIPRQLLPAPEDKKRGPKPRGDQAA